ncbi:MAG: DUF4147 domain-containing protein [Planctomycetaceae bacterium]|nr:DUF4147 domain-containing protein [Planctomycetaceae bacterium]
MSLLRERARAIWDAGIAAVDPLRLVGQQIQADADGLTICGERWEPSSDSARICVVGAGKAGRRMVSGVTAALGPQWLDHTTGWVNIPEDGQPTNGNSPIRLHIARPAGVNEPTPAGVQGTQRILELVDQCGPKDMCLVLISGGGSALLPAPAPAISLDDKVRLTRALSRAGATIQELNTVRRALSLVKGGGLLRACRAGRLIALIISDVIGSPLDVIASGPTVPAAIDPVAAWTIVEQYVTTAEIPAAVRDHLQTSARPPSLDATNELPPYRNVIIGSNATAVRAAQEKAIELGFHVSGVEVDRAGIAREEGERLAEVGRKLRMTVPGRSCLISGGEPIVQVVATTAPQRGGRNQELALAAIAHWEADPPQGVVLLAGGTDGEDGPTDVAGAYADAEVVRAAQRLQLDPTEFLDRNNSYPFFEQTGGHLQCGPTGTNVMDLRVLLSDPACE